jgi:hypothetical protein
VCLCMPGGRAMRVYDPETFRMTRLSCVQELRFDNAITYQPIVEPRYYEFVAGGSDFHSNEATTPTLSVNQP